MALFTKAVDDYKNGVNRYFIKPVDQKDFVEKMEILKKYCKTLLHRNPKPLATCNS